MDKMKLLIVEDDEHLGQILAEYLQIKGLDTTLCKDGEAGFEAYKNGKFDLCILDIMMPKRDGFSLAEDIRSVDKNMPIIFLTAKSMKEDAIKGLRIGADDYITKPFSMEELLLRINAVMRRVGRQSAERIDQEMLIFGNYTLNLKTRMLQTGSKSVRLTTKETALLKVLVESKNKTLSRSHALKEVWGDDSYFNARSMDVFITKLRKLLKDDPSLEIISVHGEGFKLITGN